MPKFGSIYTRSTIIKALNTPLPFDSEEEFNNSTSPTSQVIPAPMAQEATLRDYFAPLATGPPTCIVLPETTALSYGIRPQIVSMLPKFHGFDREDPYQHLNKFLTVLNTFKERDLSDEEVRLRLFPFSLEDRATLWLHNLPANSITSWAELSKKFLNKYYPIKKTNTMIDAIRNFRQKDNEVFFDTWERFQDLLIRCPHHKIDATEQVRIIYRGLNYETRNAVESMNNGADAPLKGVSF